MKFSTRSRYGLRAIVELAEQGELSKLSLNSIAENQNISLRYLEQLFAILKRNGYVISLRGAYGGYKLAKEPSEITVGEIIRVLEGSLAPVDCVDSTNPKACKMSKTCKTRDLWALIRDKLNETVDGITLADIIKRGEII